MFHVLIAVVLVLLLSSACATDPLPESSPTSAEPPLPSDSPCRIPAVQEYFTQQSAILTPLLASMVKTEELYFERARNPELIDDSYWVNQVLGPVIFAPKRAAEQIRALDDPPEVHSVHTLMLEMADYYHDLPRQYEIAFIHLDRGLLNAKMERIIELQKRLNDSIVALCTS